MKRFFENPFMLKELRQLTRSRTIAMSLVLYLLAETAILFLVPAEGITATTGEGVFAMLMAACGIATCLLLPFNIFGNTSAERGRSGKVDDLVLSTPLTPAQVVDGKIMAGAAVSLMFATALAPFAVAAYTLHGVGLADVLSNVAHVFVVSVLIVCYAVAVALLPVVRIVRLILMFLPLWSIVFVGMVSFFAHTGGGGSFRFMAVVLTLAALLRATAIEAVAPSGGEHSRALRLTALVAALGWLADAVGRCLQKGVSTFEPLLPWEASMTALFLFLLAVSLCRGYGYSRRQLAERRFWPFATGALNGAAFALVCGTAATLGVVVVTEASIRAMKVYGFFCLAASAMLVMRFVWRALRRGRELPPYLVPLFGVMTVVILKATASYMASFYAVDRSFWGWITGDNSSDGAMGVLMASVLLLAAIAINLPAAVATLRIRRGEWQPQGESNSSTKHEKLVS